MTNPSNPEQVGEQCTHESEMYQYMLDGTEVAFCPECGLNRLTGHTRTPLPTPDAGSVVDEGALTELWYAEFCNHDKGLCGLCGNKGTIDTRGRAISAAGVESGMLHYCICPNGRARRNASIPHQPATPASVVENVARTIHDAYEKTTLSWESCIEAYRDRIRSVSKAAIAAMPQARVLSEDEAVRTNKLHGMMSDKCANSLVKIMEKAISEKSPDLASIFTPLEIIEVAIRRFIDPMPQMILPDEEEVLNLMIDAYHTSPGNEGQVYRAAMRDAYRALQAAMPREEVAVGVDADTIEELRRIYRGLQMSAEIMRDSRRTGGWAGAEKTARAFDRYYVRVEAIHDRLAPKSPDVPAVKGEV